MHQSHPARGSIPTRRSLTLIAVFLLAVACDDGDGLHLAGAAGMGSAFAGQGGGASGSAGGGASGSTAGSNGIADHAGSNASVGGGGSNGVAGSGGISGSAGSSESAGFSGLAGSGGASGDGGMGTSSAGGNAGSSGGSGMSGAGGSAGAAGSGPTSNCVAGGSVFVVGNYADAAGNQLILRTAPKAATFALIPAGVAAPSKPPQLFRVNRVCAPGGAVIASDGSSNYRVDFVQAGSELAVCLSAPVTTLDAALALSAADTSHVASTGCAGHAFTVYTAGAL